jgi:hypothetical protein
MNSDDHRSAGFLFGLASFLICIAPGVLLLFNRETVFLPKSVIDLLYPFAILSPEKFFIVEILGKRLPGAVTLYDLSNASAYNKQLLVVALLSFFGVLLTITVQALANALPEQKAVFWPKMALGIFLVLATRSVLIQIQFSHPFVPDQPSQIVVLGVLRALLPVSLNLLTCVIAMMAVFTLRAGYRFFRMRALEQEE